jgi:hypothetical protein
MRGAALAGVQAAAGAGKLDRDITIGLQAQYALKRQGGLQEEQRQQ